MELDLVVLPASWLWVGPGGRCRSSKRLQLLHLRPGASTTSQSASPLPWTHRAPSGSHQHQRSAREEGHEVLARVDQENQDNVSGRLFSLWEHLWLSWHTRQRQQSKRSQCHVDNLWMFLVERLFFVLICLFSAPPAAVIQSSYS